MTTTMMMTVTTGILSSCRVHGDQQNDNDEASQDSMGRAAAITATSTSTSTSTTSAAADGVSAQPASWPWSADR